MIKLNNLKSNVDLILYFILSAFFLAINFMTIPNLLPWLDEMMFVDPAANVVLNGSWDTTTWPTMDYNETGGSVYPPLWQWIQILWMGIWGVSLHSARSLNFLCVLLIGFIILSFVKKELLKGKSFNLLSVGLFTVLLWGVKEFGWVYRCGRIDVLGALFALLTLRQIYYYIHYQTKHSRLWIGVLSALTLLDSIQSGVFVIGALIFSLLLCRNERKKLFKACLSVIAGFVSSMILMEGFMIYMGHGRSFIRYIIGMSQTFSQIKTLLRPYFVEILHLMPETGTETVEVQSSWYFWGSTMWSDFTYDSLLILDLIYLFVGYKSSSDKTLKSIACKFVGFALFILIFMNMVGRFTQYYRWMTYLPLLMGTLVILNLNYPKMVQTSRSIIYVLVSFVLLLFGIKSFYDNDGQWYYRFNVNLTEFHSFMESSSIDKNASILGTGFTYYELKANYPNSCFFTINSEIYREELWDRCNGAPLYIVVYDEDKFLNDSSYDMGYGGLVMFLEELRNRDDISVSLVKEDGMLRLYYVDNMQ
jgi:hypothetical protein